MRSLDKELHSNENRRGPSFRVKSLLVLVSMLIGVVAFEAASRFVLNPADYLSVTTLPDPILGITIKPNSASFDQWGFRNQAVPASADIVALGDSHTFGNTAKMREAWPEVVAREIGVTVYNMSLGGYGPNQYYHLLTTRALALQPKQVLVGLYMGDDFENAYAMTYGLEHWAFLRDGGTRPPANADIWDDEGESAGFMKPVRNWLSSHSFIYRLVVHGQALSVLKANLQFRQGSQDPSVTMLEVPEDNIREAFRPIRVAAGLDQQRVEVREGMRITSKLLHEMNRTCQENRCTLTVVIIPSKETVFSEYLLREPGLHLQSVVRSLIGDERAATATLTAFLEKNHINYVDTLPALRKAVQNELYYRGPADMHPSANGYGVIGKVVAEFLKSQHSLPTRH
jgi:hypothetical protein